MRDKLNLFSVRDMQASIISLVSSLHRMTRQTTMLLQAQCLCSTLWAQTYRKAKRFFNPYIALIQIERIASSLAEEGDPFL